MPEPASRDAAAPDAAHAARLYARAGGSRWGLDPEAFHDALRRSVAHRFRGSTPAPPDVRAYLDSLHLADLALACACARGLERAWEHFVSQFRPALLSAAAAAAPHAARDLADSIYAELFGLEERDGTRRSLFDYFHGRSSLAGWLRAVLAQRAVDRARRERRFDPLPESGMPGEPAVAAATPGVGTAHRLAMVRAALAAAIRNLPARDRLRLSLYYARELKLAAVGRVLGESEATVSRKLSRCRDDLRRAVERRLRDRHGLAAAEVAEAFEQARTDPAFDLARALPPPEMQNAE